MPEKVFDVTIIGGGPVGLFGAFYSGQRGMTPKIIDSLPELGGQLTALYPEKYIYDMPGFPKVLAKDLAHEMVDQALQFDPAICLNERALKLERHEEKVFSLLTDLQEHLSRTVLITTGAGIFSPKKLDAPGVSEFEGKGVQYFVKRVADFADKRVMIVGGGDSAVDWALNLEPVARSITLIHRRDGFRAHEESVRKLFSSSVQVKVFHELKKVSGDGKVEGAVIYDNRTKEESRLDVDAVLINVGFSVGLGPIREWGLEVEENAIKVDYRMMTNIEGVFAAGDIAWYPGKLKLIATGTGEATIAVNFAKTHIDPSARLFPGHSSERKE